MKENKKILVYVLIFLILLSSTLAFADHKPVDFILNGQDIYLKEDIYTNPQGIKLFPLREIAEELNYKVIWNNEEKSIYLLNSTEFIKMEIGNKNIEIQKKEIENGEIQGFNLILESIPTIKDGKTYVNLEFLSKVLDIIVNPNSLDNILRLNIRKDTREEFFKKSKDKGLSLKLETYMEKLRENRNFHGSVLIAKDGEVLLNKGYGPLSFKENIENKSQNKFAIGSVTKQFTAMAIMQLRDKGLLNVEDKLSKYLPDFPNGDKITIHNLLTHTSGLENYTSTLEFFITDINNKNPMNMVKLIEDSPLLFTPGESYSYSNTNYLILGIIIENLSHMSYEDYLKENIFYPLDMLDTGISYGKDMKTPDVNTYGGFLEKYPVEDNLILSQAYGAGNIYSTVEDLYRWDRALKEDRLVKKETLKDMYTRHVKMAEGISYGYGFMIKDSPFGKHIFHGGNTFGSTAYIKNLQSSDVSIIILTNTSAYDTESLSKTILNIIFDEKYEIPRKLEEITIKDYSFYDEYTGEYDMGGGLSISIIREEDRLFAQLTGQEKYEIFPMNRVKFFYKIVDAKITFIKRNGKVVSLRLNQFGQNMEAVKIQP